jgi:hypothetical protein
MKLRLLHNLVVFEDRALKGICGTKGEEVTGGWRKLRNEEFRNLYSVPDIITVIKERMRWVGIHGREVHTQFWWGNLKEGDR